jgi:hypothetical protein
MALPALNSSYQDRVYPKEMSKSYQGPKQLLCRTDRCVLTIEYCPPLHNKRQFSAAARSKCARTELRPGLRVSTPARDMALRKQNGFAMSYGRYEKI